MIDNNKQKYILITQTSFGNNGYGDEDYGYEIKSNMSESDVKKFCTDILKPCKQTNSEWWENEKKSNSDPKIHFSGFFVFIKKDIDLYHYSVHIPWCD